MKRRVRRLYFPLGDRVFLSFDAIGVDKIMGGPGVVVLIIVGGIRCVGVDEPNAIIVDLPCKTRLIRVELVNAKRANKKYFSMISLSIKLKRLIYLDLVEIKIEYV